MTSILLTDIALLLVAATVWQDQRRTGRSSPAARTWLLVAAIFAAVSGVLELLR